MATYRTIKFANFKAKKKLAKNLYGRDDASLVKLTVKNRNKPISYDGTEDVFEWNWSRSKDNTAFTGVISYFLNGKLQFSYNIKR